MQLNTTGHRLDVDGFRSIAVIAVLLHHLDVQFFSGGYIGVDIFFVISGYVITNSITNKILRGEFSLSWFYERRVRRIIPALLAMVLTTLLAGYLFLAPGSYMSLAKQSLAATFGLSNFFFLFNTGYFDESAGLLPLLHTWSLGVEEQFYLLWSIVVALLVWKVARPISAIFTALLAIIAISFLWSLYVVGGNASRGFYMLDVRAWELAAGAVLIFAPSIKNKLASEAASLAGLALIVASILMLDDNSLFPGLNALYPVFGAMLLIWPKQNNTIISRAFSFKIPVFFGLISYSLYLWHWPVIAYYKHYSGSSLVPTSVSVWLAFLSIVLAFLSWRFIERPFLSGRLSLRSVLLCVISAACTIIALGFCTIKTEGFKNRITPRMHALSNNETMWQWDCPRVVRIEVDGKLQSACGFGADWDTAKYRAVLWGDSHAQHFAPLFDLAGSANDTAFILRYGCPAFIDHDLIKRHYPARPDYSSECGKRVAETREWLMRHPEVDVLVIANAWAGYTKELYTSSSDVLSTQSQGAKMQKEGVGRFIASLGDQRPSVLLVGDVPRPYFQVAECAIREEGSLLRKPCSLSLEYLPMSSVEKQQVPSYLALQSVGDEMKDVYVFLPSNGLCNERGCPLKLNGDIIYRDNNHLRRNLSHDTLQILANEMKIHDSLKNVLTDLDGRHHRDEKHAINRDHLQTLRKYD